MKKLSSRAIFISKISGVCAGLITVIVSVILIVQQHACLPKEAAFLGISLAGMREEEVQQVVDDQINKAFEDGELNVDFKGTVLKVKASEYDFNYVAKEVFDVAKKADYKKGETVNPDIHYNKEKLLQVVQEFAQKTKIDPVKYSYKRVKDNLEISAGSSGEKMSEQLVMDETVNLIKELSFNNISAKTEPILDDGIAINIDQIKQEIKCDPRDAKFSVTSSGKANYDKESDGVDFDIEEAKNIITDPGHGTYKVPLKITKPKVTVAQLKSEHDNADCPDIIGTYTSNFSSAEVNRTHNLRKAAEAINNTVLAPGEVFSAIGTIGPGNKAQGYKDAIVYTPQGQTQGTGGGICQVTSTLYIAAVRANMDIVERHNHTYPVIYAPPGQDAAFDSGGTDLKYKNTRSTSVRIKATVTNNTLTFTIMGKKNPSEDRDVEMTSYIESTIPRSTRGGKDGYVAVARIIVRKDGVVVKEETIRSRYKPMNN